MTNPSGVVGRVVERVGTGSGRYVGPLVTVLLFYLIILPVLGLFFGSFFSSGVSFFGSFTLDHWARVFLGIPSILLDSVVYAVGSALLTTVLSAIVGMIIARTNTPFSTGYYYVFLLMLLAPPVIWERVWIFLLNPNGIYLGLLPGVQFNVYSITGMILVQGLRLLPLGLILLIPLYSNMDASLEEAGLVSGGTKLSVWRDITLPIIYPGILMVFVLLFVISLGSFRVPLVIGLRQNIVVLPTFIYQAISELPFEYGVGMAASTLLVLVGIPVLYLYYRALGSLEQYQTVSGSGYSHGNVDVGRWRYAFSAFVALLALVISVIPILTLVYLSITPYYANPFTNAVPPISLDSYAAVLSGGETISVVLNSFVVALVSGVSLLALGVLISWIIVKTDLPLKNAIDYISFLPIGVPAVALALGLMFMFLEITPIGIYGTFGILFVAYTVRYLPATIRIVSPSVMQINDELLEMSEICGDTVWGTMYSIVSPLIVNSTRSVFAMWFALIFLEMPIAIILQSPGTRMLSVYLYELDIRGAYSEAAALGVIAMGLLLGLILLIHRVSLRRIVKLIRTKEDPWL